MTWNHTPDDPRIFVFGSNRLGIHGAGAARYAREKLGFPLGVGEGMPSCVDLAYALPTCSAPGRPLSLREIAEHVSAFVRFAADHPDLRFFVSEVGCGIAGFTAEQVAPMFHGFPGNCALSPHFLEILGELDAVKLG